MQVDWGNVEAVILDLGGVILNVNYLKTIAAFRQLGFEHFEAQYSQAQQSGLFDRLETGHISEQEFVAEIKKHVPNVSSDAIIAAWNAIIEDFPDGRIETVQRIAQKFPTYLLSNTNVIHLKYFNEVLRKQTGLSSIKPIFKKAYLSHEIGLRKPDLAAFELILHEHEHSAEKTLFVDDSIQHIHAARSLGLQSVHLTEETLEELFSPILA